MSTEQIRITTTGDLVGTQVLDGDGKPLGSRIFDVEFRHRVGDVPRLTVHQYLTESVVEGEMSVERVTICPSCKERFEQDRAASRPTVGVVDATGLDDTWKRYLAGPLPVNEPEQLFYLTPCGHDKYTVALTAQELHTAFKDWPSGTTITTKKPD